jgi:hypothetical protein
VNLGTVKSRLVRGRACLKALLLTPTPGSPAKAPAGMALSLGEEAQ